MSGNGCRSTRHRSRVAGVFAELGLPPDSDDNRRVLAVLTWLRAVSPD